MIKVGDIGFFAGYFWRVTAIIPGNTTGYLMERISPGTPHIWIFYESEDLQIAFDPKPLVCKLETEIFP